MLPHSLNLVATPQVNITKEAAQLKHMCKMACCAHLMVVLTLTPSWGTQR
jgi:hypothetical protein